MSRSNAAYPERVAWKALFVLLQPFFYLLRPVICKPIPVGKWELANLAVVLAGNVFIVATWGPQALLYLLASSVLGAGFHPMAGHFIAEHYVFNSESECETGPQETFSYYGWLNALTWNVGYHNEHHDFPRIPGSRLPQLYEMAPEFYNKLQYHSSWSQPLGPHTLRFDVDAAVGPGLGYPPVHLGSTGWILFPCQAPRTRRQEEDVIVLASAVKQHRDYSVYMYILNAMTDCLVS
eukprot:scaffold1652_cov394-Prasinococcus_capsulatus_cf.AAC.5